MACVITYEDHTRIDFLVDACFFFSGRTPLLFAFDHFLPSFLESYAAVVGALLDSGNVLLFFFCFFLCTRNLLVFFSYFFLLLVLLLGVFLLHTNIFSYKRVHPLPIFSFSLLF